MFDYIVCNHELMDPEYRDILMRTKTFDCRMDQLEITKDGNLIVKYTDYDEDDGPPVAEVVPYHGDFEMYDVIRDKVDKTKQVSVRFSGRFTAGKLESISLTSRTEYPNA